MVKDLETLQFIFNVVKQVKKPIVKIFPNGNIIGTDEQFASLNILMPNYNINLDIPYIFNATEFSAFMRTLKNNTNAELIFSPYDIRILNIDTKNVCDNTLTNYVDLNYDIDQLFNRTMQLQFNNVLFTKENIQNDNYDMFSLKVADGSKMFCIDEKFLMSSFNAIHPVTKSDSIDLVIRDYDEYSYTAEFIIRKKKGSYILREFLRFRKI